MARLPAYSLSLKGGESRPAPTVIIDANGFVSWSVTCLERFVAKAGQGRVFTYSIHRSHSSPGAFLSVAIKGCQIKGCQDSAPIGMFVGLIPGP